MSFHVHPGTVYTRSFIPEGRTALKTLIPNYLQMVKSVEDGGRAEVTLYATEDESVRGFNLTFDGPWAPGAPSIVHAIGLPLLPEDVDLVLDDDGPRCGIKLPEVAVTPADVADCGRVLTALSINITGATVVRGLLTEGFDAEVAPGSVPS
jgi:hypothetical protein